MNPSLPAEQNVTHFRLLYHAVSISGLIAAWFISFPLTEFVLDEFQRASWAARRDIFPFATNWFRDAAQLAPWFYLLPAATYIRGFASPNLNSPWYAIPLALSLLAYGAYIALMLIGIHVAQQTYVR